MIYVLGRLSKVRRELLYLVSDVELLYEYFASFLEDRTLIYEETVEARFQQIERLLQVIPKRLLRCKNYLIIEAPLISKDKKIEQSINIIQAYLKSLVRMTYPWNSVNNIFDSGANDRNIPYLISMILKDASFKNGDTLTPDQKKKIERYSKNMVEIRKEVSSLLKVAKVYFPYYFTNFLSKVKRS